MNIEQINKLIKQREEIMDNIYALRGTKSVHIRETLLRSIISIDKLLAKLNKTKPTKTN